MRLTSSLQHLPVPPDCLWGQLSYLSSLQHLHVPPDCLWGQLSYLSSLQHLHVPPDCMWGPTQLPIHFALDINRMVREADRSPPV